MGTRICGERAGRPRRSCRPWPTAEGAWAQQQTGAGQDPPRSPGPAASPKATGNRGSLSPSVLRWFEVQQQASDPTEMIRAVNTRRPKTSFQMHAPAPQIGPVRGFGARVYLAAPRCTHFPCLSATVSRAWLRRQSDGDMAVPPPRDHTRCVLTVTCGKAGCPHGLK